MWASKKEKLKKKIIITHTETQITSNVSRMKSA